MEIVKNGSSSKKSTFTARKRQTIPDDLLNNPELLELKSVLPMNYNFEIEKSIVKVRNEKATVVGLQLPEGLLMYACLLGDIITKFTGAQIYIMGDVTFGACCIDDLTSFKLGVELLIHYGHSCLVPLQFTKVKVMYVFVEIYFDTNHLMDTIKANFPIESKLAILGTVQFSSAIYSVSQQLVTESYTSMIPQCKPLSPGETLGCTSPVIPTEHCESVIFISDGRFHLESAMIQNPLIQFYRYDPYVKILSKEGYNIELMKATRL